MPFKSKKQQRWAHTEAGERALGGPEKVGEWDKATDEKDLPESVKPARPAKPAKPGAAGHALRQKGGRRGV